MSAEVPLNVADCLKHLGAVAGWLRAEGDTGAFKLGQGVLGASICVSSSPRLARARAVPIRPASPRER
jgi:hypothetical protein